MKYRLKPGRRVHLKDFDPSDKAGLKDKEEAKELLPPLLKKMETLQERLYAEQGQALLIVLQAMDTGGKDGTIRKVMAGLNPSGCYVVPFKVPCAHERARDFLWRVHHEVPAKGQIAIFNRSHYEDVLVPRVHGTIDNDLAEERFEQIRDFERLLWRTGTRILKFFLHISKEEQKERLQARWQDPQKRWKFSLGDIAERKHWKAYARAYEAALSSTSTRHAPWYVIPANHKWVRNVLVAQTIVATLEEMGPHIPPPQKISKPRIT